MVLGEKLQMAQIFLVFIHFILKLHGYDVKSAGWISEIKFYSIEKLRNSKNKFLLTPTIIYRMS